MRVNVSLVFQNCRSLWSDFNADNRRDFYCENTCLLTWPEVTFWPGIRGIWPLHFDSGTFIQQEGVRGWTKLWKVCDFATNALYWGNIVVFRRGPGPSRLVPEEPGSPRNPRSWALIVCLYFLPLNVVKLNSRASGAWFPSSAKCPVSVTLITCTQRKSYALY